MDKEIRKLIIENPSLPIKFFVGEDANIGDYSVEVVDADYAVVEEVAYYKEMIYSKGDFEETLLDSYTEEEVKQIMSNTKFERIIAIRIG